MRGDDVVFEVGRTSQVGLTKREFFAAMALLGTPAGKKISDVVKDAVETADALITELNKGNK